MTEPGLQPGGRVRVRFAPAPSGDLHVGNIRTALYNWAFARRAERHGSGGDFVFRVEDTDRSRATDEAYSAALDVLSWLGLDWDEGPGVGGPYAPYRQSERLETYAAVMADLQEQGAVYPCFCSAEELAARREEARRQSRPPGYDGRCRDLTPEAVSGFEAEGRRPVMRFRMPQGSTTFTDLVRGEVTTDHSTIPDFALTRSDGHPLYMLAATVDDVLMRVTHIVRGEDLLSAVPRQLALYAAMGVAPQDMPSFGHLPLITGDDGKPLSKRNGEVSIAYYRREGFTPEAMVNYLALLGWSLDAERESFSLDEMVDAFDLGRVSSNPARFDIRKLEAINGDKIRELTAEDLLQRMLQQLQLAHLIADPPDARSVALVTRAVPLVQTRMKRLTEVAGLLGFALVDEDRFVIDPGAAAKVLIGDAGRILRAASAALDDLEPWTTEDIGAAMDAALVAGLGLKRRNAYAPVRVAVTGSSVAPPLPESMELLGRDRTLSRLRRAVGMVLEVAE